MDQRDRSSILLELWWFATLANPCCCWFVGGRNLFRKIGYRVDFCGAEKSEFKYLDSKDELTCIAIRPAFILPS